MLILRPNLERAKMSNVRSCGQSTPTVKHISACSLRSMAAHGCKGKFKLIHAKPLPNGKADPNPRVECGFCSFVFNGGTSCQRTL